jgi:ADP-ribosylglycohydrolase
MTVGTTSDGALTARLVGGVWGHLVGDAVGVPYEFRSADATGAVRWGETGSHGQPPGTWTDDGALMLALLDSLTADGVGFDVDDQGRRALAWGRHGAYTPDREGRFDWGLRGRRVVQGDDHARHRLRERHRHDRGDRRWPRGNPLGTASTTTDSSD